MTLKFLAMPSSQYIVSQMMDPDSEASEKMSSVLAYAGIISHCMCYFNSAINPIIYYFMSAQFKVIICTCLQSLGDGNDILLTLI